MDAPQITRTVRKEVALDIARPYLGMCSRIVVTFDSYGWQVLLMPKRGERFEVVDGPKTVVVYSKNGQIHVEDS